MLGRLSKQNNLTVAWLGYGPNDSEEKKCCSWVVEGSISQVSLQQAGPEGCRLYDANSVPGGERGKYCV